MSHTNTSSWTHANQRLVAKMLSELAHERVIDPVQDARGYRILANGVTYRFQADRLPLDHWRIKERSVVGPDGDPAVDAADVFLNLAPVLGVPEGVVESYLEEIIATASCLAYHFEHQRHDAASLARSDFQSVEAAMSAGHPCFIANSGRIGFNAEEYAQYAPECSNTFAVRWLAGRRDRAHFASIDGLSYTQLLTDELGLETLESFEQRIRESEANPRDYVFIPVHPWQWSNKIQTAFANELACGALIDLGTGHDRHQPQQSVRTLFNRTRPDQRYVKTSLSILNMGFMRGLSPEYMAATPAINQWVRDTLLGDPELSHFTVLREVAAVGYRHPHFERGAPKSSGRRKMLAALWRESPVPLVAPDSQLMTMAALVHRDRNGAALLPELITESGLSPTAWLEHYLATYLRPLLHCFYTQELVFMPHGENLILELRRGVPVRAFIKDIGEEILLFNTDRALPPSVGRIALAVDDHVRLLHILSDVFDSFLRFLAEVFDAHTSLNANAFWGLVAQCVHRYQDDHPELAPRFERFDLFVPQFERLCLNRMQLANNVQMLNLTDPVASFQYAGTLENPIGPYRDRQFHPSHLRVGAGGTS